jgi:predicted RNA methylase
MSFDGVTQKEVQPTMWCDIDKLDYWDNNPNDGDIGSIIISIKEHGYNDTQTYWNGIIKGGNHSVMALQQLRQSGWHPDDCKYASKCLSIEHGNWQIAMIDVSEMDETDADAFGVALNRTARLGYDDPAKMVKLLQQINEKRGTLHGTGYDADDLDELLHEVGQFGEWDPPRNTEAEYVRDVIGGFNLSSFWKDLPRENDVSRYFLPLPKSPNVLTKDHTAKRNFSRTNATETERIVKTYMRSGDVFYEMCCGWMTFSSTAKYFGYNGKGSDIWDKSIKFCERQLKAMKGEGKVSVGYADCRDTEEPANTYDFVHSNPPFFNLESYGGSKDDLSATGKYDFWLQAMGEMGREAERILRPGGIANFVINDFREKGRMVLMHADFVNAIIDVSNLQLHDIVIAEVVSQSHRFWRKQYNLRKTTKCHEYIITFKKPDYNPCLCGDL